MPRTKLGRITAHMMQRIKRPKILTLFQVSSSSEEEDLADHPARALSKSVPERAPSPDLLFLSQLPSAATWLDLVIETGYQPMINGV